MKQHISLIDDRLKQLQDEVQAMEQQYGFSKEFQQQKQSTIQQKSDFKDQKDKTKTIQSRYQNLPNTVKSIEKSQQKQGPSLSNKWVEIFKEKPNLMQFFNDEFLPILTNPYDIVVKPSIIKRDNIYEDYMDNLIL